MVMIKSPIISLFRDQHLDENYDSLDQKDDCLDQNGDSLSKNHRVFCPLLVTEPTILLELYHGHLPKIYLYWHNI